MIKKKYIRKKKKNPRKLSAYDVSRIISRLSNSVLIGRAKYLTDAISYIKTGEYCDDCNEEFMDCECEKCDECLLNRCLCNIGVNYETTESNEVRVEAIKIAKETFSKEDLKTFYDRLNNRINAWTIDEMGFTKSEARDLKKLIDSEK